MLTFHFTSNVENDSGKEFLVGIDDIEQLEDNTFQFVFDGIENTWFQEFGSQNLLEVFQKMIPYLFIGKFRGEIFKRYEKLVKLGVLSRWFLITIVDNKTDLEVTQFIENTEQSEAVIRYISSISALRNNNPTAIKLNNFFSWNSFPVSNEKVLANALRLPNKVKSPIHKLNVYNVGQGNLCSITDQHNLPIIYFDLGGGWRFNHATYPITKKLCFTVAETIIISHWDWDHLETARRYSYANWAQFNGKNWIVPQQNITSSYMKLACLMATTGNLLVWPTTGLPLLSFWGGQIILCNGSEKNHSGLALIVESQNNFIKNVLHPADAAYMYIPGITALSFDGIVATHHGANFDLNNSPIPLAKGSSIVYSHANRYGHPTALSVQAHQNSGWTDRKDTTGGSISFTTLRISNAVPCGSKQCDLEIIQNF